MSDQGDALLDLLALFDAVDQEILLHRRKKALA
jgi:hypothetical protein